MSATKIELAKSIGKFRCGECGEDVSHFVRAALDDHNKSWSGRSFEMELTAFETECEECGADLCFIRMTDEEYYIGMPDQCKGMFALVTME